MTSQREEPKSLLDSDSVRLTVYLWHITSLQLDYKMWYWPISCNS